MSISTFESAETRQSNQTRPRPQNPINVGDNERLITGAVGGLLVLAGLRKPIPGLLVSALGGALLQRAFTGHCPAYEAMGFSSAKHQGQPARPEEYFQRGIHVEQ